MKKLLVFLIVLGWICMGEAQVYISRAYAPITPFSLSWMRATNALNGNVLLGNMVNLLNYGASGDGVTDDTASFQTALNSNRFLYVPRGNWLVRNLTVTLDGTTIYGAGFGATLRFADGSTGAMIDCGTNRVSISGLQLDGGTNVTMNATSVSPADRTAIKIFSQVDSSIRNCSIHGFGNYGIRTVDYMRDLLSHLVVDNVTIYDCYIAALIGPSNAEYTRWSNLDVHDCYYGLWISSGNVTVNNSKINSCYYGVYVLGTGIGNNGHGNVNGCLLNHNTFPIYCENVSNGHNFVGNNIFYGTVYLKGSTDIKIQSSIMDVDAFWLEGGGYNCIRDNHVLASLGNTITHAKNGVADATYFIENPYPPSGYLDSARLVVSTNGVIDLISSAPLVELGNSLGAANFGFLGWNAPNKYLFLGNSYGGAYNENVSIWTNGYVGVNNSSPLESLDVKPRVKATGNSSAWATVPGYEIYDAYSNTNNRRWAITANLDAAGEFEMRVGTNQIGDPWQNGTTKLRLDKDGNLLVIGKVRGAQGYLSGDGSLVITQTNSWSGDGTNYTMIVKDGLITSLTHSP